jgi:hypothetical protein
MGWQKPTKDRVRKPNASQRRSLGANGVLSARVESARSGVSGGHAVMTVAQLINTATSRLLVNDEARDVSCRFMAISTAYAVALNDHGEIQFKGRQEMKLSELS